MTTNLQASADDTPFTWLQPDRGYSFESSICIKQLYLGKQSDGYGAVLDSLPVPREISSQTGLSDSAPRNRVARRCLLLANLNPFIRHVLLLLANLDLLGTAETYERLMRLRLDNSTTKALSKINKD